jgi:hypothetical protein
MIIPFQVDSVKKFLNILTKLETKKCSSDFVYAIRDFKPNKKRKIMSQFALSHEINCDQDGFWARFFDSTLNEKFYKETLAYPDFKVLEQTETDTNIFRKLQIKPALDMPGPIAKLLGPNYSYIEEGSFDKSTQIWTWKQIPSTLVDKLLTQGSIRLEPIDDGKVRRISSITVVAKVFGVGGLIESTSEKQIRQQYDISAKFFSENSN